MTKKRARRGAWIFIYTAAFMLGVAVYLCLMLAMGKTLVWWPDGVKQHYTVLGYVGKAVRGLLNGEGLPMMSLELGQGLDVMTTTAYYGYTDPLSLLAAFSNERSLEIVYAIIAFLRLFLTGLLFGVYAKTVGIRDDWAVACGQMIFTFCGYFTSMAGRHPYFINGGLYLLLVLIGVERVLHYRKWALYVLAVALMLIVNFYFAYMNTLFTIVYIIVRLVARARERRVRGSATDGFTLLGGYVLGAALSAVVLLPVILVFLENGRYGVHGGYEGSLLHYGRSYYALLASDFFVAGGDIGAYTKLGFAPTALLALLALFTLRGARARQLRVGLLLCLAGVCIPLVGKLMNAMSYVTNRWSYMLALMVALGSAAGFPALFDRSRRSLAIGVMAIVYAALLAGWFALRQRWLALPSSVFVFLSALVVIQRNRKKGKVLGKRGIRRAMALLIAVSCMLYIFIEYSPTGENSLSENMDRNIPAAITSPGVERLREEQATGRINRGFWEDPYALLQGYMGGSFYWSLVSGAMGQYYNSLYLPTQPTMDIVSGLGGGSTVNAVSSTRWFIREGERAYTVPYGFEASAIGDGYTIYENRYALPLAYTYQTQMTEAEYESLDVADRLQAIAEYAIVEEPISGIETISAAEAADDWTELSFTVAETQNIEWTEGSANATSGGRVQITFEAPSDHELYLIWDGIESETSKDVYFTVTSEAGATDVLVLSRGNNYWFQRNGCAVCLGSGELSSCDITFWWNESCRWESLRLVALPLEQYRRSATERMQQGMTDIQVGRDQISGRIDMSEAAIMQIAIPYSKGWSAVVDGEEKEIMRCGGMYMGIALGAGTHDVTLKYRTPGFTQGLFVSFGALLVLVILLIRASFRRKSKILTK